MSNYPDGWSRADEIAAGIAEEYPGFERHFESLLDEMTEEEYEAADIDALRETALDEYRDEMETAKGEDAAERAEYEATQWDGYEPW